jgi:hypothetical protein
VQQLLSKGSTTSLHESTSLGGRGEEDKSQLSLMADAKQYLDRRCRDAKRQRLIGRLCESLPNQHKLFLQQVMR